MKNKKSRRLEKRPVLVFLLVCVLFAGGLARIAWLQKNTSTAAMQADRKYVEVARSRGSIYDRAGRPLVNGEAHNTAVFIVNENTSEFLEKAAAKEDETAVYNSGVCVAVETRDKVAESLFATNIGVVERYGGNMCAKHVIGYLDPDGRGVCGIEKSFDRILQQAGGRIGVRYAANAYGQAIAGEGLEIVNEQYNNPAGVVLTLEREVQEAVESALESGGISRGAAVVLDAQTGEILALASVPVYDIDHLEDSLKNEDLPFLNRALAAYPVGSVFKPFVAAAAVERSVTCPADYECRGYVDVNGTVFHCYRHLSHGTVDLTGAIEKSCNCYFISLASDLGAAALCETCRRFGFGAENRLTGDLIGAAGVLPNENALRSPGALANLSFGQGALLASPLQLAAAFAALANGGTYHAPYLLRALIDEHGDEYARYKNEEGIRAVGERTARQINECLYKSMLEGTGKNGASTLVSSAGKTATAQTGDYASGQERLCTWFCGFFPYETPKYAVAVLNENGASAAEDCAPVFRAIMEGMYVRGLL